MRLKKLILLFIICLYPVSFVQSAEKNLHLESSEEIKREMVHLLSALSDLDEEKKGNRFFENDLNLKQTDQIILSIHKIRALDKNGYYKKELNQLETNTNTLVQALKNKDSKAYKYSEAVFNACFNCHQTHRAH